jgi:hypothetical protein
MIMARIESGGRKEYQFDGQQSREREEKRERERE